MVLKVRASILKSVVVTKLRSSGPLIRGQRPSDLISGGPGLLFVKNKLSLQFFALIRVSGQNCANCSAHAIVIRINSVHGFRDKRSRI